MNLCLLDVGTRVLTHYLILWVYVREHISGADTTADVIISRSKIKTYFSSLGYWAEINTVLLGAGVGVGSKINYSRWDWRDLIFLGGLEKDMGVIVDHGPVT